MTKPNLPKDTPAGTKILVDGFPGVFLGHAGDLPIWHWSETDKSGINPTKVLSWCS